MRIKEIEPGRKKLFIVSVVFTIGLVSVGWFFSFKNYWQKLNPTNIDFSQAAQIKKDVQEVTADFKSDIQSTSSETVSTVQEVTKVVNEGAEQRKDAINIVSEKMKTELDKQTYEETQKNN